MVKVTTPVVEDRKAKPFAASQLDIFTSTGGLEADDMDWLVEKEEFLFAEARTAYHHYRYEEQFLRNSIL